MTQPLPTSGKGPRVSWPWEEVGILALVIRGLPVGTAVGIDDTTFHVIHHYVTTSKIHRDSKGHLKTRTRKQAGTTVPLPALPSWTTREERAQVLARIARDVFSKCGLAGVTVKVRDRPWPVYPLSHGMTVEEFRTFMGGVEALKPSADARPRRTLERLARSTHA